MDMPNLSLCLKHRLSHFRIRITFFLSSARITNTTHGGGNLFLGWMANLSSGLKFEGLFYILQTWIFQSPPARRVPRIQRKLCLWKCTYSLRKKFFLKHGASFEINSSEVSMTYSSSLIYTCEHSSSIISAGNGFLNKTDESHHFTTYLPSQMLTVKTP